MSSLDDLIKRLCPDGVPFKALGEVGTFVRGNGIQKGDLVEKGFPAIHYGQIHTHYDLAAAETLSFVSDDFARKLRKADPGDLVIVTTSEDDESVGKAVAWVGDTAVAVSTDAYIYRHSLDPRYVSYFFQSSEFQGQKRRHITGTKVRRISGGSMAKITIPVPPLEVQREISRVLDGLKEVNVELGDELAKELVARRQQHAYYRDAALNFREREGVKWVAMGELVTIGTGSRNTNEAVPGGPFPFFVRSQEPLAIDEAEFDEVAIITAGDGVGVGKVFHFVEGSYALHQRAYRLHVRSPLLVPKFLFHYIRNDFARYLATTAVHASVTSLRKPMFENYPVPLPVVEEQRRIASHLDAYESIVADLSSELSSELTARKSQYKYLRDQLLTFKEAA